MKQIDQLKNNYIKIQQLPSKQAKRLMLEGLKEELAQMQRAVMEESGNNNDKEEITETLQTSTSHLSIMSNYLLNDFSSSSRILPGHLTGNDEIRELEANILKKQKLKIALNEAIQQYEEEYLDLQADIYNQQEKAERLDKEISKKTLEISRSSAEGSVQIHPRVVQNPSLAEKFICFFLI